MEVSESQKLVYQIAVVACCPTAFSRVFPLDVLLLFFFFFFFFFFFLF